MIESTATSRNDILENFGTAVELVFWGAYAQFKAHEFTVKGSTGQNLNDMCFEMLCVLHERMTKDEMLHVLMERIHD